LYTVCKYYHNIPGEIKGKIQPGFLPVIVNRRGLCYTLNVEVSSSNTQEKGERG